MLNALEGYDWDPAYKMKIHEMISFWQEEAFVNHEGEGPDTVRGNLIKHLPPEVLAATSNSIATSLAPSSAPG